MTLPQLLSPSQVAKYFFPGKTGRWVRDTLIYKHKVCSVRFSPRVRLIEVASLMKYLANHTETNDKEE